MIILDQNGRRYETAAELMAEVRRIANSRKPIEPAPVLNHWSDTENADAG